MAYKNEEDKRKYQREYYKKNKDRIKLQRADNYKKEYERRKEKYRKFNIEIEKPLAYKLENKLVKEGISIAEFFRRAIEDYIK